MAKALFGAVPGFVGEGFGIPLGTVANMILKSL